RSIIHICSQEVPGVASVSEESLINGAFKMLRSTDFPKGIRITNGPDDQHKKVDVSIRVEFGYAIPPVATELQKKVKNQVERITGILIDEVNVHVDGVHATAETPSGPRVMSLPPVTGAVEENQEGPEPENPALPGPQ
ncbi:MAG: Asp23/Gls24 family envelope stress response protein, partial [Candidatus Omnitrophica bacterium]|nr:Asp23/Gls24 family envelope stress response protein [Candidatus Omnitrophota bacterium]